GVGAAGEGVVAVAAVEGVVAVLAVQGVVAGAASEGVGPGAAVGQGGDVAVVDERVVAARPLVDDPLRVHPREVVDRAPGSDTQERAVLIARSGPGRGGHKGEVAAAHERAGRHDALAEVLEAQAGGEGAAGGARPADGPGGAGEQALDELQ